MFAHSRTNSSSDFHRSEKIEFIRDEQSYTQDMPVMMTSNNLHEHEKYPDQYAWLIEPYSIHPNSYNYAIQNAYRFKKVFSHNKRFCDIVKNSVFIPYGDCWIKKEDWSRNDEKKEKSVSIIASNKQYAEGHKLRHQCLDIPNVDHFGFMNPVPYKKDAIAPYEFHIVVENERSDCFFTEKLMDCFALGTVPIYWGCPSIGEFFNLDGMIIAKNLSTIGDAVDEIKHGSIRYEDFRQGVLENFTKFQKYVVKEDLIYPYLKD